jgi:hypothetical protein
VNGKLTRPRRAEKCEVLTEGLIATAQRLLLILLGQKHLQQPHIILYQTPTAIQLDNNLQSKHQLNPATPQLHAKVNM